MLAFVRVFKSIVASLAVVLMAASSATSQTAPTTDFFSLRATPLNDAPDFSELKGEITLLILFQPNCAWCPIQFKHAEDLKRNRANWLQIAAVSRGGSIQQLLHELDRYQTPFPGYKSSPELLRALEYTPGTPCIYLIGKDGHLGQYTCGRKTEDELVRFLMGKPK